MIGNSDRNLPKILITRSGEIDRTHSNWYGFLSEIKKSIDEQGSMFQRTVGKQNETVLKDMDDKHKEIQESIKQLQNRTYNIEHLLV